MNGTRVILAIAGLGDQIMAFGKKGQDHEEEEGPQPGIGVRWRVIGKVVRVGLGVGTFSVLAGTLLADATTEHGSGASKVAWFLSSSDRAAMRRAATAALTGDVPTGTIKLDPCALPKK
jgi:hypothetical protein